MSDRSIVEYFAEHEKYRCGYCGGKDTNYSHGIWAHVLTVQDYQDLIDRGWRRSGCYTYKPTMNVTCCPHYTIKCKAEEFRLTKSQKKVIKKVNRYLNTGEKSSKGGCVKDVASCRSDGFKSKIPLANREETKGVLGEIAKGSFTSVNNEESFKMESNHHAEHEIVSETDGSLASFNQKSKSKEIPQKGEGADPNKPVCKKAKLRRKEAWLKKQGQQKPNADGTRLNNSTKSNKLKTLQDHLNDVVENPVHELKLRLVRSEPASSLFKETFTESHAVYKKYQMVIHKDKEDEPTVKQYTRFLCNSPLTEKYNDHLPEGMGSFHQQYLLDGKIIAVGVIDILPNCISSVYLYYDPDYDFLSLGTYSALREIDFTQSLHKLEPNIEYYYMGYYVHSCPKMKYKGNYFPSFLACPETYDWFPIEECTPLLDANKYSRFAKPGKKDPHKDLELEHFLVLYNRQALPYMIYKAIKGGDDEDDGEDDASEVLEYGGLVGNVLAKRILLYRK